MSAAGHVQGASLFLVRPSPRGTVSHCVFDTRSQNDITAHCRPCELDDVHCVYNRNAKTDSLVEL
jgi:hypothetical protein